MDYLFNLEASLAVPAHLDGLVVVPVHVAHEEVVDGHVHDVEQPPPTVVRLHLMSIMK